MKNLIVGVAFVAFAAQPTNAQTGKIVGKISFAGTPPAPSKIRMSEPKCMAIYPQGVERKQVDGKDGGLMNVVVSIKAPVKGAAPAKTEAVVLDQVGCMYTPAALALQVGQPLKIRNSDDLLHNVHPRPVSNAGFNVGQPRKGMEKEVKFDKAENFFPVSCDVHPWMRSYIAVFAHPFFTVTKEDGTFEISGVPPGDYEVEATHPTLKSLTGKVSVKAGTPGKLDLTFTLK